MILKLGIINLFTLKDTQRIMPSLRNISIMKNENSINNSLYKYLRKRLHLGIRQSAIKNCQNNNRNRNINFRRIRNKRNI